MSDDMILTNKQVHDDLARKVQADMQVILDDWIASWSIIEPPRAFGGIRLVPDPYAQFPVGITRDVQPVLDGQVTVEVGAVPE